MTEMTKSGYHHYIAELESNTEVFRFMFSEMPAQLYVWKPSAEEPCALEVLCLLLDEEKADFGNRMNQYLQGTFTENIHLDKKNWSVERKYMDQNFHEKLQEFLAQRKKTAEWLQSLENIQWKENQLGRKFAPVTAEMILTDWLSNDYTHIRQILHLKFDYIKNLS